MMKLNFLQNAQNAVKSWGLLDIQVPACEPDAPATGEGVRIAEFGFADCGVQESTSSLTVVENKKHTLSRLAA